MGQALLGVATQIALQGAWYALAVGLCVPYSKQKKVIPALFSLAAYLFYLLYLFLLVYTRRGHSYQSWINLANNALAVVLLCVLAGMTLLCRLHFAKIAYLLLIGLSMATMVSEISWYLCELFFPAAMAGEEFFTPYYLFMTLALQTALLPFICRLFGPSLKAALAELSPNQFARLCITPALFTALVSTFVYIDNTYQYPLPLALLMLGLLCLTGITTYATTLRMIIGNIKHSRTQAAMRAVESQLALQAQHYEMLTGNIEKTQQARHDMRHHLSVLARLTRDKNLAGLAAYLDEYGKALSDETTPSVCANYIVDAVVRHYLSEAAWAGAEIDIQLSLPRNAGVPDVDLCIVFGNLLENAAQSVKRQTSGRKFIRCRGEATPTKIVLTVDNSTDGDTCQVTGVGLASVRAIAEKYDGFAKFEQAGGQYQTSILLQVPNTQGQNPPPL